MLSPSHVSQFDSDGFVVLESLFSAAELAPLVAAATRIVADFDADKHRSVFRTDDRDEGRDDYFLDSAEGAYCFLEADALDADGNLNRDKALAINKIGHAMHASEPAYADFCRDNRIGDLLRALGQAEPQIRQTMYIFKQPGIGGEVRWHQDASYLISERGGVIGLWIALEAADRNNGCLWVQPGRHREDLREIYEIDWERRSGTLTTLNETPWTDNENALALEVPVGSVVAFHDHMPHFSSYNSSSRSRHAFTIHATARAAPWSERNWLQPRTAAPFLV